MESHRSTRITLFYFIHRPPNIYQVIDELKQIQIESNLKLNAKNKNI